MSTAPIALVMGTSQYDGVPSQVFAARLDTARRLYERGEAQAIAVVGGKLPGDRFTEAEAGAAYLAEHGVPRSALLEVPEGHDTRGSLRAVGGSVDKRTPVIVVTDRTHLLRAVWVARREGYTATGVGVRSKLRAYELTHEAGGLAVIAVDVVAGERWARRVERGFRTLGSHCRPSLRARMKQLY
ncbi:hypothetical protein CCICO_03180 [Corynebacterium ciconiae DSM 44920]|uniref:YdcF family protein n=1 Tax=Corynebacterium ciconiae TaxID=227319 RepID=UPI0003A7EC34|nr:YdcF family protein [Corynebacterium ciconiae]WKD60679.1 hypothetical protein CCICO_03180 [Corynebacterium ciconiae DSM 44920]